MNTQNMSDDELDDFFKKSLEKPDIDFREEAWLEMEKKLDTHTAQQKTFYRRFLLSLAALLLLSGVLVTWYISDTKSADPQNTIAIENKNVEQNEQPANQLPTTTLPSKATNADLTNTNKPEVLTPAKQPVPALDTNTGTQLQIQKTLPNPDKIAPLNPKITGKIKPDTKKIPGSFQQNPVETGKKMLPDTSEVALKTENKLDKNSQKTLHPITGNADDNKKTNNKQKTVSNQTKINHTLSPEKTSSETTGKETKTGNSQTSGPVSTELEESKIAVKTGVDHDLKKTIPFGKPPYKDAHKPANADIIKSDITKSNITDTGKSYPTDDNPSLSEKSVVASAGIDFLPGLSARILPYQIQFGDIADIKIPGNDVVNLTLPKDSITRKLAKKRINSRVSISLLLSPDLSSVGFSHITMPGTNVGLSLAYQFSERLSVSVGSIYSTKIYDAYGKDYLPRPNIWHYYPMPALVNGRCKVIDIPINISYKFLLKEKYNLYASTGLSSYLMLKEDYEYTYDTYYPNAAKSWHGKNENKHFFKVYNISVGYERKLNQRFSIQAEPFLKLPMTGVGYGKIKLLSTGAFFSLKYNL